MHTDYVRIFDTTLRDGEQSPGATMTLKEKLRIATQLEELGVDVIEAGFPAASSGELDAVRTIASVVKATEVAALCRTRESDIRAAWTAIEGAARPRLHTFIATSRLHLEHKLKMTREQVLEAIRRGVSTCRTYCDNVEFSAEDATRSDLDFLKEAVSVAVNEGATTINVPDTVGYTTPEEYSKIIQAVVEVVGPDVVVSAHCHDDLGLAVANSLAAVQAGARQVEGCMNGIGERAGNAALEEVVMALQTRSDVYAVQSRIRSKHLVATSRMVSAATGFPIPRNKAIVGKNAFAHEAGIHQHGVLHDKRTYEIMSPEDVGASESSLVLGKHSGRHALVDRLQALGYSLSVEETERCFTAFKALADKKKDIYDEDLHVLVADDVYHIPEFYNLESVEFRGGNGAKPWASVKLRVEGEDVAAEGEGDGPINAAMEAIKRCTQRPKVRLEHFHVSAVTDGDDAQGKVALTLREDEIVSRGQAAHTDVVVASAMAFVHALNHQMYQRELKARSVPPPGKLPTEGARSL